MPTATPQLFQLASTVRHRLEPSPTLYINERVNELWAAGETVYHLGFGESRFPVHPKIWAALRDNAAQKSYLPTLGLRELREAAANFYSRKLNLDVTAEQLIIGPGSKPLYFIIQLALEADLFLPTPSWVSYGPQANLIQKPVYHIPSDADANYPLTIEAIDATVRQSNNPSKILLLNSPNNPTGQMFDPAFLAQLADYCRAKGIMVLSDEIYSLVPHGHRAHVSPAHYYPEGTVVLGGLSKHLSLGGWRLGTAILPDTDAGKSLLRALRVIAGELWSSPTGPVQYAAITAYQDEDDIDAYIDECAAIHAIRT
ncbi:MAG: aminotransferase class I/II-fold pyridoxal phosphate-dependent enzyme [Caldilineaceae bacterium]|nr:aminotransferase class I/II-fold pyridoxal phosphate-dependent enzyme [Caldilineaceae bacterium]